MARSRAVPVLVMVNDEEKRLIEAAAEAAGLTVSGYVRMVVLAAARK